MTAFLFIAAAHAPAFFRAGLAFTRAGGVFDTSDWSEATLARIRAERHLHVREASPDEIASANAGNEPDRADPELAEALLKAIPGLPPGAFKADGHPKLPSIRAALPDVDPKAITADTVGEVMETLFKGGFKPPSETI